MTSMIPDAPGKRLNGHGAEAVSPPAASFRWDTEALVVRGDDRAELRQRMRGVADFLTRTPAVELKDVAFTLNTALAPGGCRLAVVADSVADLQARLVRAAERLDDPGCRHIKDTRGCYFFEEPLHPQGKLALLFPGEGGQYLNMLRDLIPHFPEVRAHFEESDRLSTKYGRPSPISTAILIDDDAPPAERAHAERELWYLNNAIASILLADWALYRLLGNLGIQPDAIASHSAGEFLALSAAGSLEHDDDLLRKLFTLGEVLRRQEDDGAMKFALLATGTNRKVISALIAQLGVEVHVAMDNCPHQTVLGGSSPAVAAVEAELKSRGIVCERLLFNRPYHTPLFEPFLAPVARMYESLPVRTTRTPTYSCITGQLLPDDPNEIRRLGVEHWARPVEFVRMIENMHADGVRLFVECGPRGNLTSFVQDTLRGRPFEAVASNLAQRSGLSQLNHMAALLAAHHVPLRFEHFYNRRSPQTVAWEASGVALAPREQPVIREQPVLQEQPALGALTQPRSPRAAVMQRYFSVMEQFLDMEREVMEQFLARRCETRSAGAAPLARPLLGEIIRYEPGHELVLRRRMDLSEDLYASDHTLGARDASAVDPTQHGLPFMPMAFSVEMMAEAAAFLLPGQLVIGLKRVRLQRWIPFDDEPITLELTARIRPDEPSAVAVEIRDLGNAVMPGNADSPAVVGTVLLGTHYPEPPPPEEFLLTHEGPCGFTAHQLYAGERRLFHGPLFEALEATDRQGDEGIEGHLRTLPHSGLFRSTPQPDLILDPLLIDASTHLLGSWHLSQPDQNGRVVLPYELGNVTLYGPRPATGTPIKCRVRVESGSARQVSHRIDLIGPDDRLWCRLSPAEYWRFYWPLEYVDFFRFKERFLLAKDWSACLAAAKQMGRCVRLDPPSDLCQPVHRMALARVTCSRSEWQTFRLLKIPDNQLTDWLFGRIAAKDAVRALWLERHGQRLFPADIEIDAGPHGRTRARYRGGALAEELPTVSFAHAPGVSAALAAFVPLVGIALHRLADQNMAGKESPLDATERALLDAFGTERTEWNERFRCATAAVANALGASLADDPRAIVVRKVDRATGRILVALGPRLLEAYPEFRLDLLAVYTVRDGDLIVATTFCERDRL
jgi:malonyl CoA-acyl carrier protein transacylase